MRQGESPMNINADKLSELLKGEWIVQPPKDWYFETLTISKAQCKLEKGKANLFIAIDEETWHKGSGNIGIYAGWKDTHHTVQQFSDGLAGIIVQRPIKNIDPSIPQLLVENSYEAMKKIGVYVREETKGKVIAITGTAGKSSTKNMLELVLKDEGSVVATRGNHNTRTGVSLTLACAITQPDYLILEMAISALWMPTGGMSTIAKPHLSIITSIGGGQKKTPLETAYLKAKVCEGIMPGGFALLNKEMLHFEEVKKTVENYGAKVFTYSHLQEADIYLIHSVAREETTEIKVNVFGEIVNESIPLLGEGMISNTLAVLGASSLLELNAQKVSKRLKQYKQNESILQFESINHYKGGSYTLIDDAWNATELSMLEAIEILKQQKQFHKGKSIAVLGRIENLGEDAKRQHQRMIEPLINSNIDLVFAHGPEMKYVLDELPFDLIGGYFENAQTCAKAVTQFIEPGDLVLLKGSPRASDFKHMKKELKKHAAKKPVMKYKSLGNYLATDHASLSIPLLDDDISTYIGNQQVIQKQGIGNVLLLCLTLDQLFTEKVKLNDNVVISRQAALESKNRRGIPLTEGESVKLGALLEAFIVHDSPNAMLALAAHLFGNSNLALKEIQALANRLSINLEAVKNVTGRRISNLTQITTLEDLIKAAKHLFNRLPYELTHLNKTTTLFKEKELKSFSHLIDTQKVSHALMYGENQSIGISLINLKGVKFINIVLGARDAFHRDYLVTQSLYGDVNEASVSIAKQTDKAPYKVNILADTYFGEFYTDIRKRRNIEDSLTKYDYNYSFAGVRSILNEGDYNIANFEAALTEEKVSRLKPIKPFVLYAHPELTIKALKKEKIDAVTLGNNHLMDFESEGLSNTVNQFKQAEINTFGAGETAEEAEKPLIHMINGKRIVYFSAYWYRNTMHRKFDFYANAVDPGVACLSGGLVEQIKQEKKNYPHGKVVVIAHWGVDFQVVHPLQRRYAHVLVNAGADLILGHGAHMMQEIEKINHTWVVYSLGNGIFNSNGEYGRRHAPPYSFIAQLLIEKSQSKLKLYPIYSDNLATFWQPRPVNQRQFNHLLDIQKSHGLDIDTSFDINISKDKLGFLIEMDL